MISSINDLPQVSYNIPFRHMSPSSRVSHQTNQSPTTSLQSTSDFVLSSESQSQCTSNYPSIDFANSNQRYYNLHLPRVIGVKSKLLGVTNTSAIINATSTGISTGFVPSHSVPSTPPLVYDSALASPPPYNSASAMIKPNSQSSKLQPENFDDIFLGVRYRHTAV